MIVNILVPKAAFDELLDSIKNAIINASTSSKVSDFPIYTIDSVENYHVEAVDILALQTELKNYLFLSTAEFKKLVRGEG